MQRSALVTHGEMKRALDSPATIAAIAPLVGLFGAVYGISDSFPGLGTDRATALGAIAQRLLIAGVTTALGLAVALLALWCYRYLTPLFLLRYAAEGIDYTRPHSFMPLTAAYRRRGYLSLLGCDSQDSSPEKPAALADSIDQVSSASSDN